MTIAYDYINNNNYVKLPLVGNHYTGYKITNKDTDINLIYDIKNKYDKNAIKVISIKNTKKYNIGFISKDKTYLVKNIYNKLKFITIIKRIINSQTIYYYLIFKKN